MDKFPTVFLVTRITESAYRELIIQYTKKGYRVEKEERHTAFDDGSIIMRIQMKLERE